MIPQISQCPVVESLPGDLGSATPYAAVGPLTPGATLTPRASAGSAGSPGPAAPLTPGDSPGTPGTGRHIPRPSRSRFGSRSPPTARATLPSVSLPASP